MTKNVGGIDKILRVIVGLALIAYGVLNENFLIAGVGIIPIFTAVIGWCPLYCPLGIKTNCSDDSCKTE